MAEPQYQTTCRHCGKTFMSNTFLAFPLCEQCWQSGHRGTVGTCRQCRSDYYAADEPFAAKDDD